MNLEELFYETPIEFQEGSSLLKLLNEMVAQTVRGTIEDYKNIGIWYYNDETNKVEHLLYNPIRCENCESRLGVCVFFQCAYTFEEYWEEELESIKYEIHEWAEQREDSSGYCISCWCPDPGYCRPLGCGENPDYWTPEDELENVYMEMIEFMEQME